LLQLIKTSIIPPCQHPNQLNIIPGLTRLAAVPSFFCITKTVYLFEFQIIPRVMPALVPGDNLI
jgi:hypothetical protein